MRIERTIVADRGAAEPISLGAALATGKKVAPDAIGLLVMDHLEAKAFFERYRASADPVEKLSVARRLCRLLTTHMRVEEEIFYPASRKATGDDPMVDHAVDEHEEGKGLIAQLERRETVDEIFHETIEALRQVIEQHVAEEETRLFPEVRAAGRLDLYELGALMAARRLEIMLQLTDKPLEDAALETRSEMSVGRPLNMAETGLAAIDKDEARKLFLVGLRNAHATEKNCRTMAERQTQRVESYPKLKERLAQHLAETDTRIERLEQVLESMGESPSALKDAAATVGANVGAMTNAMAGDEVLKNSFADAAMAQFQIAAYKSLLLMGEAAGEVEAIRLLQKNLSDERAWAAWLEENLTGTVLTHLQLRSAGEQAKH
jgi:ferritin-like metal-binding protein YciE